MHGRMWKPCLMAGLANGCFRRVHRLGMVKIPLAILPEIQYPRRLRRQQQLPVLRGRQQVVARGQRLPRSPAGATTLTSQQKSSDMLTNILLLRQPRPLQATSLRRDSRPRSTSLQPRRPRRPRAARSMSMTKPEVHPDLRWTGNPQPHRSLPVLTTPICGRHHRPLQLLPFPFLILFFGRQNPGLRFHHFIIHC